MHLFTLRWLATDVLILVPLTYHKNGHAEANNKQQRGRDGVRSVGQRQAGVITEETPLMWLTSQK